MAHTSRGRHHVRSCSADGGIFVRWNETRARTSGEIDNNIAVRSTDAFRYFAIEFELGAGLSGLWIAHMDMDNRRAGFGCFERGDCNLLRSDRNGGMLGNCVASAGDGAGYDDLTFHAGYLWHRR